MSPDKKRGVVSESSHPLCDNVVKAVLDSHDHWDEAAESRATELVQSVHCLVPPGQDLLPVFSLEELRQSQELDSGLSRVMPFLSRKRRPSRREKDGLDRDTLALIKQWERLKVIDRVLYRVAKDPLSKQKRHQFVMPQNLIGKALSGVHDLTRHQGQARTIHLARHRFFWHKMEHQIKDYVKCCQRCILAKTPDASARAPLKSIRTSAPMELVCLDFWTEEDNKQRSVDVLVLADHFTKLAAPTNRRSQKLGSYATTSSVCTGLQDESTQIKEPILRVSSLQNCSSYQGSPSPTLQHTTLWGTEELRDLTGVWAVCSFRCH